MLMTELREHFEGKFDVQRTFKTKLGQLCHRFMPLIQGQVSIGMGVKGLPQFIMQVHLKDCGHTY